MSRWSGGQVVAGDRRRQPGGPDHVPVAPHRADAVRRAALLTWVCPWSGGHALRLVVLSDRLPGRGLRGARRRRVALPRWSAGRHRWLRPATPAPAGRALAAFVGLAGHDPGGVRPPFEAGRAAACSAPRLSPPWRWPCSSAVGSAPGDQARSLDPERSQPFSPSGPGPARLLADHPQRGPGRGSRSTALSSLGHGPGRQPPGDGVGRDEGEVPGRAEWCHRGQCHRGGCHRRQGRQSSARDGRREPHGTVLRPRTPDHRRGGDHHREHRHEDAVSEQPLNSARGRGDEEEGKRPVTAADEGVRCSRCPPEDRPDRYGEPGTKPAGSALARQPAKRRRLRATSLLDDHCSRTRHRTGRCRCARRPPGTRRRRARGRAGRTPRPLVGRVRRASHESMVTFPNGGEARPPRGPSRRSKCRDRAGPRHRVPAGTVTFGSPRRRRPR